MIFDKHQILPWFAAICGALALFGIGILIVGYKEPSIGRIATIVLMAALCLLCIWFDHRDSKKP